MVTADLTGTIAVEGTETAVRWPERSCYRHAIAITSDGIENGYVEPIHGPADTQYDCYPGDDAQLSVATIGEARRIEVTLDDRCTEETWTESFDLQADDSERIAGVLYDFDIAVEDGSSDGYTFTDGCWGVHVGVNSTGDIRIHDIEID